MKNILQADHLQKTFEKNVAVKDISFTVSPGEVLGIVGPNGAGKTTTLKMILGLLIPDKGHIKIFGKSAQMQEVKTKIGYMPETPLFYAHLTGRELLLFVGEIFKLERNENKSRADTLLGKVGLSDAANRPLRGYSKGMLQRICLAQALMNNPELLFLDEPLDGLDPIGRISMKEILLEVKRMVPQLF